jgi:hypothetical protein
MGKGSWGESHADDQGGSTVAATMAQFPSAVDKQAGRIPRDGTKRTHGPDRELFKACVLDVQYGMGPEALARRIGKPTAYGCELLRLHRETKPTFWRWSDGAESHAMLLNRLRTVFWMDGPGGTRCQPAFAPERPLPGQRGRDVAVGVLPGDGKRRQRRGSD